MSSSSDMEKAASRKEALIREKNKPKQKSSVKEIKNPNDSKLSKPTILSISGIVLAVVGLTSWLIVDNFITQPDQAITIAGPQTLSEELIEDESIIESPVMDRPGGGAFGLPTNPENPYEPSEQEFSIEDYSNQSKYTIMGEKIPQAQPSAAEKTAYRVVGAGLTGEELVTRVANALTVNGSIQRDSAETSWGVLDGSVLDEAAPNVTYRTLDRNNRIANRPVSIWFYSEGYVDCNLNIDYDITGYTSSELAAISKEDKDCYYSSSAFGMSVPFPANETTVINKSENYMERLGYNTSDFKRTVSEIEGLTIVTYAYLLEGDPTTIEFEFVYSDGDKLRSASGMSFEIQSIGEYRMEKPFNIVDRLNNILYYTNPSTEYDTTYTESFNNRPYAPDTGPSSDAYITHLLITYDETITRETNPTPPGLSTNYLNISNPSWVKQVDASSNTWLVSLGQEVNEDDSLILTGQIDNSPEIVYASVDTDTIRTVTYSNDDTSEVQVDDYVEIWGEAEDFDGNILLMRSYLFIDSQQNMMVGSVIAYEDEAIGIR